VGIRKELGSEIDESTEDYLARLRDNYDGDTQETYVQRRVGHTGDEKDWRANSYDVPKWRWWILVVTAAGLVIDRIYWTYLSGRSDDFERRVGLVFIPLWIIILFLWFSWLSGPRFWKKIAMYHRWYLTGSLRRIRR